VGAAIIESVMDARAVGLGLWDELIQHPGMLLYRTLFVLLGLVLGWLLWQKNKRERDFRHFDSVKSAEGPAFVMHKAAGTLNPSRPPSLKRGGRAYSVRLRKIAGPSDFG
jgi:hypothetical protein